jgi:hypothetical protein
MPSFPKTASTRSEAYRRAVAALPCLRCGTEVSMQFRGMCPACTGELRAKYETEGRVVAGAEYEPTMHVTPNAVALKDD